MKIANLHKCCPFCGGMPKQKGGPLLENNREIWYVECSKCRISQLAYSTKDISWEKWDIRKGEYNAKKR